MLDEVVIIGVTMVLAQIIKPCLRRKFGDGVCHQVISLVVLGISGGLNVLNAWAFGFGTIPLLHALAEGIKLGAVAGGVYSMGKATLGMK